jgi:hypothetical protein
MKKKLFVEIMYEASIISPDTLLTHLRALVFRAEGLVDVKVVKPMAKDEILETIKKGVRKHAK